MILLLIPTNAMAISKRRVVKQGNALFVEGDFEASVDKYTEALKQDEESDIINFNIGTALYKTGEYKDTIRFLQKSLLSDNDDVKQKASYNLGNTLYKYGVGLEDSNIDAAITSLEKSLGQYENSLNILPDDEDARFNYDFVKKELERLRRKKEEKKKQQQQKKQQNKQDREKDQSQKNDQDQKDKEQKDQESTQSQKSEKHKKEKQKENQDKSQGSTGEQDEEDLESKGGDAYVEQEEMTKEEAEMLLNEYQQKEEPQGLLNFAPSTIREQTVTKDW